MTKGFLIGLFAGAAIGAITILLMTPQEGAASRRVVGDVARSAGARAKNIAVTAKGKATRSVQTIRQAI